MEARSYSAAGPKLVGKKVGRAGFQGLVPVRTGMVRKGKKLEAQGLE